MIMGLGFVLMAAGAVLLAADLVFLLVTVITAPGKKRKIEQYLKERY